MGIILGYLCLIFFCLLLAKALTHKFQLSGADKLLERFHRPLSRGLAIASLLHLIFVLPVFRTRNIFVYVTGGLVMLLLFLLTSHCYAKKSNRRLWLRRHRISSCFALLCTVGHIMVYYSDFQAYQAKISSIQLQELDISNIESGKYIGEYDAGYIYVKVQVTIHKGEIQSIRLLEHRNERGQAAKQVIPDILKTQKFPVDATTGATNSSKVIQKAIQNALREEPL